MNNNLLADGYSANDLISLHDVDGTLIMATTAEQCSDALGVQLDNLHERLSGHVESGRFYQHDRHHFTLMSTTSRFDKFNLQSSFSAYFKQQQRRRGTHGATDDGIELIREDEQFDFMED